MRKGKEGGRGKKREEGERKEEKIEKRDCGRERRGKRKRRDCGRKRGIRRKGIEGEKGEEYKVYKERGR